MRKAFFLCLSLILTGRLFAQDPHFSQYFASPLSLNPANTGFFDGDFRLAVNERQQWWNVGFSYTTTSISADAKILSSYLPENDVLAVGVVGLFDRTLNGALSSNYVSVSGAYHLSLAAEKAQVLTVGLQFTYANRYIDFNNLTFASQFNGQSFDLTMPSNVNTSNSTTNYFDAHAGLLYSAHSANANWYAGASLYHIAKPNETIFNAAGTRVPFRETLHAGGELNIGRSSGVVLSGLYMAQANARDEMLGAAYAIKNHGFDHIFNMYLGMWLRLNDAYIPYLGFDYQNFSLGLNYSLPYNSNFNYRPSTIEISFVYRRRPDMTSFCPHF